MVECESDMTNTLCIIIDVLIDTWWNVNTNNESAFFNFSSFNRYMVECEFIPVDSIWCNCLCVLIDTWWNVNEEISWNYVKSNQVLIDTWWNVNMSDNKENLWGDKVLIDTWWNVNNLWMH